MQMRVRVSLLKAGFAVGENGSDRRVTDSSAMARVLASWLIRTGFLLVAASTVLLIKTHNKRPKKNL
ncbi:MAG TPA: hypothetical protein VLB46_10250 [Pyrinomonadaceae bacterium]|nr:hypothetical protein [Pyrinomonadaceae bacterium]